MFVYKPFFVVVLKKWIKKMDYKKMSIKEKNPDKYKKLMKDKKVHKILICKTSIKSMKYTISDINSAKNMKKK
jgi:hypothetical protein